MTEGVKPRTRTSGADDSLAPALQLAFAPLHKRAFGTALGLASGLIVFGMTVTVILRGRPLESTLWLLKQYFLGYSVTIPGALVGFAWGFIIGFVAGWFIAFCRNMVIATSIFIVRTKAELSESRDFLDHI